MDTSNYTYEYLPHRGIDKETFRFYEVKTKINAEGKPISVGFRYKDDLYKVRSFEEKKFYWTPTGDQTRTGLFGMDRFSAGENKSVTITEGEYDALSLYQVLRSPVVSVQSSGSGRRDCSVGYEWLNAFDRIYLAFDNDQAGRDLLHEVAKLFDPVKVYVLRFTKHKDANAYLKAGEGDELRNIWHNAKKYLPDKLLSSFSEFRDILSTPTAVGVPYPFPTWTKMTYGLRKGETVLLTAQEKVGKTEVMHAIERQLLRETNDSVAALYPEEPPKRHLQALAGLEIGKPVHLPDSGVEQAQVVEALERLIGVDERLYVGSNFGSDDPDVLLDKIRFLVTSRNVGWVLLDHLSMVVSGLAGEDIRRAIDYFCTQVQTMVKSLDFGFIMVCHLNDFGQTRDSRYPPKICDIHFRIERDKLSLDPTVRNTIHSTLIDNRFSGQSGPSGDLIFDPTTFRLAEAAANDNWNQTTSDGTAKLVA